MKLPFSWRFSGAILAGLLAFTGCNAGGNNFTVPFVAPTPAAQHLYIADGANTAPLLVFNLPLSATSTPSALVAAAVHNIGVAANSSFVAAQATAGATRMLAQPVSSSSTIAASFGVSNTFPAFAPSGQFYTSAGATSLQVYSPPFSNASTPSSTITFPIGISSVAVDPSGNIYVNNGSTGIAAATSGGTITASITIAGKFYRGMAATATQLFACNVSGGTGTVDIFTLPLTNASTPAVSITAVNGAEGCAVDASGNLYVSNVNAGTISRFAAPFTNASTANLTLTVVNPNTDAIFGIAVGA